VLATGIEAATANLKRARKKQENGSSTESVFSGVEGVRMRLTPRLLGCWFYKCAKTLVCAWLALACCPVLPAQSAGSLRHHTVRDQVARLASVMGARP